MQHIIIAGTGHAAPERVLTNYDLEKMVETSDEWIRTRTGIVERRVAGPGDTTVSLADAAARRALERAGLKGEDVDLVIVATVTPDTVFPAAACLLQDHLGARNAAAFDLSAGCSGFVYAVVTASQFLSQGAYRTALVVGAETLTRITNWKDRGTCVLFGDGAGAVVLRAAGEGAGADPGRVGGPDKGLAKGPGLLSFTLGSDGSGGELLMMPGGGSRRPASVESVTENLHFIHMNGAEVFKFAVRIMTEASLKVLGEAGISPEDLSLFIPHQANVRIIDAAVKRLGLRPEQVMVNVDRYGNTSSASIGIALDEAVEAGRIHRGDRVLMVGFGAGLTWGAALWQW